MRKDELLYLHQLLSIVREDFERRGVADPSAFGPYDDDHASPMAVYASKADHRRAVRALAAALADATADERERAVASA